MMFIPFQLSIRSNNYTFTLLTVSQRARALADLFSVYCCTLTLVAATSKRNWLRVYDACICRGGLRSELVTS